MKALLSQLLESAGYILPALLGGLIDYVNQLQSGRKSWAWGEFMVHLSSAVFFGWLTGLTASGLGYSVEIVAAAGGMGGFLGVRVADVATHRLAGMGKRRRGPD